MTSKFKQGFIINSIQANCLQSGNGTETLLTNAELNRLMIANQNRQAGHGGPPVLVQNQSPTMTQATTGSKCVEL